MARVSTETAFILRLSQNEAALLRTLLLRAVVDEDKYTDGDYEQHANALGDIEEALTTAGVPLDSSLHVSID